MIYVKELFESFKVCQETISVRIVILQVQAYNVFLYRFYLGKVMDITLKLWEIFSTNKQLKKSMSNLKFYDNEIQFRSYVVID